MKNLEETIELCRSLSTFRHTDPAVREVLAAALHHIEGLRRFKEFVHGRLDQAGVPTHPDGPHSKEGCRIGDRLDIVLARDGESRAGSGAGKWTPKVGGALESLLAGVLTDEFRRRGGHGNGVHAARAALEFLASRDFAPASTIRIDALEEAALAAEGVRGGFTAAVRLEGEEGPELIRDPDGPWVLNTEVARAIRAAKQRNQS